MIRTPKPICRHPLENKVTITLRSFLEKVTEDITPWFFKLSKNCPSKLHESEFFAYLMDKKGLKRSVYHFFSLHIDENVFLGK